MFFPSRLTSFRPGWWGVFGLLVAVPAVVLAIVGLKAIDADAAERARQRRDQLAEVARLADAAIASALDRARAITADTDAPASGTLVFNVEPNGVLSFPRHRVYFGPFGLVPSAALATR